MVNESELIINLVSRPRRKIVIRLNAASRYYSSFNIFPALEQPWDNEYLKGLMKVNYTKLGKSDKPHALRGKEEHMRKSLVLQDLKGMVSRA